MPQEPTRRGPRPFHRSVADAKATYPAEFWIRCAESANGYANAAVDPGDGPEQARIASRAELAKRKGAGEDGANCSVLSGGRGIQLTSSWDSSARPSRSPAYRWSAILRDPAASLGIVEPYEGASRDAQAQSGLWPNDKILKSAIVVTKTVTDASSAGAALVHVRRTLHLFLGNAIAAQTCLRHS